MAIEIAGKVVTLGGVMALLVLIAAFVLFLIGGVSTVALLVMIGFLALAILIG